MALAPQGLINDANTVFFLPMTDGGGVEEQVHPGWSLAEYSTIPIPEVAGVAGNARRFNSIPAYFFNSFSGAIQSDLNAAFGGAYTVEMHIKLNSQSGTGGYSATGERMIFGYQVSNTDEWWQGLTYSPVNRSITTISRIGGVVVYGNSNNNTLIEGAFVLLGIRVSSIGGGLFKEEIFVNGVLQKVSNASRGPVSATATGNSLAIGCYNLVTNAMNAEMDLQHVRFSNVARTDAQMFESYRRLYPLPDAPPIVIPPEGEIGVASLRGTRLAKTFQALHAPTSPVRRALGKFHQVKISEEPGYLVTDGKLLVIYNGIARDLTVAEGRYDNIVDLMNGLSLAGGAVGIVLAHNQVSGIARPTTVAITGTALWYPSWADHEATAQFFAMLGFNITTANPTAVLTHTGTAPVYYRSSPSLEIATAVIDFSVLKRRP